MIHVWFVMQNDWLIHFLMVMPINVHLWRQVLIHWKQIDDGLAITQSFSVPSSYHLLSLIEHQAQVLILAGRGSTLYEQINIWSSSPQRLWRVDLWGALLACTRQNDFRYLGYSGH